jgi:hypothetical protein
MAYGATLWYPDSLNFQEGAKMSQLNSQIAQNEQKMMAKHLSAAKHIEKISLPCWYEDFLEESVFPPLIRIGFDKKIAENIFRISAPAWKLLGSSKSPKHRLHPVLARYITEIQRNVVFLPTNWILLPRSHSLLTTKDSLCLIVYLQHVDRKLPLSEKILFRILVEFIGNYSLKFASPTVAKKIAIDTVFYGYAAMFWKNLLRPPFGLEELLIFKNYLSWARAYKNRTFKEDPEKNAAIREMEEMEEKILPDPDNRSNIIWKTRGKEGIHITLRHGRPGINHALQLFFQNNTLLCGCNLNHLSCEKLPRQLHTLLKELSSSYFEEHSKTKEFIETFLIELAAACRHVSSGQNLSKRNTQHSPDFTKRRMSGLIRDFRQKLH